MSSMTKANRLLNKYANKPGGSGVKGIDETFTNEETYSGDGLDSGTEISPSHINGQLRNVSMVEVSDTGQENGTIVTTNYNYSRAEYDYFLAYKTWPKSFIDREINNGVDREVVKEAAEPVKSDPVIKKKAKVIVAKEKPVLKPAEVLESGTEVEPTIVEVYKSLEEFKIKIETDVVNMAIDVHAVENKEKTIALVQRIDGSFNPKLKARMGIEVDGVIVPAIHIYSLDIESIDVKVLIFKKEEIHNE